MTDWATLDGERIMGATITIPWMGAWSAEVLLASPVALPALSTLVLGGLSLVGVATRSTAFAGSRGVRIVGGHGGWRLSVPSRSYRGAVTLAMVLGDAAIETGEVVLVGTDRALGTAYVREEGPASRLLRLLCPSWYVDATGVTQVRTRATASVASDFTLLTMSGAQARYELATERLEDWIPARTFKAVTMDAAVTISSVTHHVTNEGLCRTEVLAADDLANGAGEAVGVAHAASLPN
jgi:hypothetical protein